MILWLLSAEQKRYRLIDRFAPSFYVTGSAEKLGLLERALAERGAELSVRRTERMDLWQNRAREVVEVGVPNPGEFFRWGRWVHRFDERLQLYDSDLLVASLYCWEKGVFPLARVEAEVGEENRILALECRDDEWAMEYELPPFKVLQIRFAWQARADSEQGPRAALEIEIEGRCWG
ncbi:MAG: hypothetical protein ACRD5L_15040, partial [Bryobacteraceae bacterium]